MPGGDRTGPMGMGPMTGRGAGYCAGYQVPGYANPWGGRGRGRAGGFGGGRGWRNMYHATGLTGWQRRAAGLQAFGYPAPAWETAPAAGSPEQELELLKSQSEGLNQALDDVNTRIRELEKAVAQKKD